MSHHGREESPITEELKKEIGPTKKFPDGKMNASDEGGIKFAVGEHNGKIILDFGTPVQWIGFDPKTAMVLAKALFDKALKVLEDAEG